MNELEEMRQQMARLKEKLDKETIASDKLLREVTRQKVRRLNRNVWQMGFAATFVITFGSWSFYNTGNSWWFIGLTIVFMIVCFLCTLIPHLRVNQDDIMSGDLLQVVKEVRRLKKFYHDWLFIGIPSVIIWFALMFLDLYWQGKDVDIIFACLIGGLVGGAIGGTFGYIQHKKFIREMDDIVNQIEGA